MIPLEYGLAEMIGIELEYMIVDTQTLDVKPIADDVLKAVTGKYDDEVQCGDITWSNELARHVIELKTSAPVTSLRGLGEKFAANIQRINRILASMDACLMPSAMHPWMRPQRDMQIWPHADNPVYRAFDRIFDCTGHGWANLQSMHINLSFGNGEEFGRLHAAMRMVLPILPALAASSPIKEGKISGVADTRLDVYRHNADRFPRVAGNIIPEQAFTPQDYVRDILEPIYRDLQPHDPEGVLRHEWVNSRGCIARFDRNSCEIRLLDVQECPDADLAIAEVVVAVVRALCAERLSSTVEQRGWQPGPLGAILDDCIALGGEAVITNRRYLQTLGIENEVEDEHPTAMHVWRHLAKKCLDVAASDAALGAAWHALATHGCLSRRLRRALGAAPSHGRQREVYQHLCDCLQRGTLFVPT